MRSELLKERKEYKEWCKERKREYERQKEEKMRNRTEIRTEQEAWKYINRFRKKREVVKEEISEEEWKQHFMDILEGEEQRE